MKLTLHFEDGTKQSYQAPEWARWVEVTEDTGVVFVWDKEPTAMGCHSNVYLPTNNERYKPIGRVPRNQLGQLELSKIQFHR